MTLRPHPTHRTTLHRLRRHQSLSPRRPQGLCVRAERGSLWLTVDGELDDIELAPGASRVFDGTATVVIGTLGGDAVASVTATRALAWPQRLQAWLHSPLQWLPA